ncbi:unnamed protein product [Closterium sp. NIES-54]
MVHQDLQRFSFRYFSSQSTPPPTGHSLSAPPLDESVEPSGPYPELVGCLMYPMTCTRPDLAYPLSIPARYVAPGRHRPEHWEAAKRVLRYLCTTSGMGFVLGGRGPVVLTRYADASWVDDLATQRTTGGWGAASGGETSGRGTSDEGWGASREDHGVEEEEIEAEPTDVPLGRPPHRTAPVLPPPVIQPGSDPWETIDLGNEPSTQRRTVYGLALEPREPIFFPGTIPGTNIPLSTILDREFLALMLTTANGDDEAEETVAEPAQEPDKDPAEAHARYMRTSGFRADDAFWHQRLGHPSRVTLKNCIEAGVVCAWRTSFRPDGTEVRGVTNPRNCTVCPEAALSHQPFPLLEPRTNHYAKLEKLYSESLNVGDNGINDELYTLTFVEAGMRYVWVVNVEAHSRAYEVFHLWLAHAQRQSVEPPVVLT